MEEVRKALRAEAGGAGGSSAGGAPQVRTALFRARRNFAQNKACAAARK